MQSIQEMVNLMNKLPAPESFEQAIAHWIINNMAGYQRNIVKSDVEFIAYAIQAYAKMLQDAGVKVEG